MNETLNNYDTVNRGRIACIGLDGRYLRVIIFIAIDFFNRLGMHVSGYQELVDRSDNWTRNTLEQCCGHLRDYSFLIVRQFSKDLNKW